MCTGLMWERNGETGRANFGGREEKWRMKRRGSCRVAPLLDCFGMQYVEQGGQPGAFLAPFHANFCCVAACSMLPSLGERGAVALIVTLITIRTSLLHPSKHSTDQVMVLMSRESRDDPPNFFLRSLGYGVGLPEGVCLCVHVGGRAAGVGARFHLRITVVRVCRVITLHIRSGQRRSAVSSQSCSHDFTSLSRE